MTALASPLGALAASLALSFLFWIGVAYSALRMVRFGLCSVCGAVVTVWSLNLLLGFLPGWMTLLLLGQSAVGGSSLLRDLLFAERIARARTPAERRPLVAASQLVWFGALLVATIALGGLGLVLGLRPGLPPLQAFLGLLALDAVLVVAFAAWVVAFFVTERRWGLSFCSVCAAVSSVWVANLFLHVLPSWATLLLMGQSVAGLAGFARDRAAEGLRLDERLAAGAPRRFAKQAAYFSFLLAFTLAAAALAAAVLPVAGA